MYKDKIKEKASRSRWNKLNPWAGKCHRAKQRCTNVKVINYRIYGGKGIKFLLKFDQAKFLWFRDKASDMKCASLDRINSNGNYELSNCRFIENSLNQYLGAISQNKNKTHCKHGHEYNKSNTYIIDRGNGKMQRNCRICKKNNDLRYRKNVIS